MLLSSIISRRLYSSQSVKPAKRIFVEGNIGSGKTQLMNYFRRTDFPCTIQDEPVAKWRNVKGNYNLLNMLYENPSRFGFVFQSYVQLTMYQNHTSQVKHPLVLSERSLHSARKIFVENLYRSGFLRPEEYVVLDEFYEELAPQCKSDLFIYLKTKPDVCLKRIQLRNRPEEKSVSIDLLERLHDLHEEWFLTDRSSDVVVINSDRNINDMGIMYERIAQYLINNYEKDSYSDLQRLISNN